MLKMRFARAGRKKDPVFFLVVAESKSPRDGKFVEKLGTYTPRFKDDARFIFNEERVKYWLTKGTQLTDRAQYLLGTKGIVEPVARAKKVEAASDVAVETVSDAVVAETTENSAESK